MSLGELQCAECLLAQRERSPAAALPLPLNPSFNLMDEPKIKRKRKSDINRGAVCAPVLRVAALSGLCLTNGAGRHN